MQCSSNDCLQDVLMTRWKMNIKLIPHLCNTLYIWNLYIHFTHLHLVYCMFSWREECLWCAYLRMRDPHVYVSTHSCVSTFWELINQCRTLVYSRRLLINLWPQFILSHFRLSTDTKNMKMDKNIQINTLSVDRRHNHPYEHRWKCVFYFFMCLRVCSRET